MARSIERLLAESLSETPQPTAARGHYDAIERLLADMLGGQQAHPGRRLSDIEIHRPDDAPIAIELKIFRTEALFKDPIQQLATLMKRSVETRRSYGNEVTLCAVILFAGTVDIGPSYRHFVETLARRILRHGDEPGYDSLIVGAPTPDMHWIYFDAELAAHSDEQPRRPVKDLLRLLRQQKSPRPITKTHPIDSRLRILLVADEWRSGHGGISTVNRELAIALATAGVETAVLVPTASNEDVRSAAEANVMLVAPPRIAGLIDRELLLLRPVFGGGSWEPDIVIGHGRLLGPYAYAQQQQFFPRARRVHIVHMDAEQLESAKEALGGISNMRTTAVRRNLETELARSSDLVVGIGPLLAESIRDDLLGSIRQTKVIALVPGLRMGFDAAVAEPPVRNRVLFVGRADDFRSKGIDIAAEALLKIVDRWPPSRSHPPALVVRGVPHGAETAVKAKLDEIFEGRVNYYLRPFSDSEADVMQDYMQARVVVMPSRHEGFGLAAYEAIGSGVPVLITSESGLAQFLQESNIDTSPSSVVATRNSSAGPAIDQWANAIERVLVNPKVARDEALNLRKALNLRVSWGQVATQFLQELRSLD